MDTRGLRYARTLGYLVGETEDLARVVPGRIILVPIGTCPDGVASIVEVVRQRMETGRFDPRLAKRRLAPHGLRFRPELTFVMSFA